MKCSDCYYQPFGFCSCGEICSCYISEKVFFKRLGGYCPAEHIQDEFRSEVLEQGNLFEDLNLFTEATKCDGD